MTYFFNCKHYIINIKYYYILLHIIPYKNNIMLYRASTIQKVKDFIYININIKYHCTIYHIKII